MVVNHDSLVLSSFRLSFINLAFLYVLMSEMIEGSIAFHAIVTKNMMSENDERVEIKGRSL